MKRRSKYRDMALAVSKYKEKCAVCGGMNTYVVTIGREFRQGCHDCDDRRRREQETAEETQKDVVA